MGIPNIIPLILRNPSLFETYVLQKCQLIIDGKCLENYLYNNIEIDKQCGGDYDVYATNIENFFNALQKFEVESIVVFDGGYEKDDRKLATLRARAQNRINDPQKFAPLLIHETFLSTIRHMKIKHVVCDFEADHEMVVLANEMSCPLLSFDSDFFIFELIGGYIPLADINISLLTSGEEITRIQVKMFRTRHLTTKFPYLKGKLALLASALGNDYVSKESNSMQMFYKQLRLPKPDRKIFEIDDGHFCVIIRKVLHWLENCGNMSTGEAHLTRQMSQSEIRAVRVSIATYSNTYEYSTFDLDAFMRGLDQEETSELVDVFMRGLNQEETSELRSASTWMVHNHRQGNLPNFMQNVILNRRNVLLCQMEDIKSESSHACSKPIRQVMYGILLGKEGTIQELDRNGDTLVESTVQGITLSLGRDGVIPNPVNINRLKIEQRLEVLQKAMTAPLPDKNLAEFNKTSVLFAMVLIFWLKCSKEDANTDLTSSLLLCFIILSIMKDETANSEVLRKVKHIEDSLEVPPSLPLSVACHP